MTSLFLYPFKTFHLCNKAPELCLHHILSVSTGVLKRNPRVTHNPCTDGIFTTECIHTWSEMSWRCHTATATLMWFFFNYRVSSGIGKVLRSFQLIFHKSITRESLRLDHWIQALILMSWRIIACCYRQYFALFSVIFIFVICDN